MDKDLCDWAVTESNDTGGSRGFDCEMRYRFICFWFCFGQGFRLEGPCIYNWQLFYCPRTEVLFEAMRSIGDTDLLKFSLRWLV